MKEIDINADWDKFTEEEKGDTPIERFGIFVLQDVVNQLIRERNISSPPEET